MPAGGPKTKPMPGRFPLSGQPPRQSYIANIFAGEQATEEAELREAWEADLASAEANARADFDKDLQEARDKAIADFEDQLKEAKGDITLTFEDVEAQLATTEAAERAKFEKDLAEQRATSEAKFLEDMKTQRATYKSEWEESWRVLVGTGATKFEKELAEEKLKALTGFKTSWGAVAAKFKKQLGVARAQAKREHLLAGLKHPTPRTLRGWEQQERRAFGATLKAEKERAREVFGIDVEKWEKEQWVSFESQVAEQKGIQEKSFKEQLAEWEAENKQMLQDQLAGWEKFLRTGEMEGAVIGELPQEMLEWKGFEAEIELWKSGERKSFEAWKATETEKFWEVTVPSWETKQRETFGAQLASWEETQRLGKPAELKVTKPFKGLEVAITKREEAVKGFEPALAEWRATQEKEWQKGISEWKEAWKPKGLAERLMEIDIPTLDLKGKIMGAFGAPTVLQAPSERVKGKPQATLAAPIASVEALVYGGIALGTGILKGEIKFDLRKKFMGLSETITGRETPESIKFVEEQRREPFALITTPIAESIGEVTKDIEVWTPRMPPTLSGGLVSSVLMGFKPSPELQKVWEYGPEYMAGSLMTDILLGWGIGKGVRKGLDWLLGRKAMVIKGVKEVEVTQAGAEYWKTHRLSKILTTTEKVTPEEWKWLKEAQRYWQPERLYLAGTTKFGVKGPTEIFFGSRWIETFRPAETFISAAKGYPSIYAKGYTVPTWLSGGIAQWTSGAPKPSLLRTIFSKILPISAKPKSPGIVAGAVYFESPLLAGPTIKRISTRTFTGVQIFGKIDPSFYLKFVKTVPPAISQKWFTQMGGLGVSELVKYTPKAIPMVSPFLGIVPSKIPTVASIIGLGVGAGVKVAGVLTAPKIAPLGTAKPPKFSLAEILKVSSPQRLKRETIGKNILGLGETEVSIPIFEQREKVSPILKTVPVEVQELKMGSVATTILGPSPIEQWIPIVPPVPRRHEEKPKKARKRKKGKPSRFDRYELLYPIAGPSEAARFVFSGLPKERAKKGARVPSLASTILGKPKRTKKRKRKR